MTEDYAWLRLLKLARQKTHERAEIVEQKRERVIAAQKYERQKTRLLMKSLGDQFKKTARRQSDLARKFDAAIAAANVPEGVREILRRQCRVERFVATGVPYYTAERRRINPDPDKLLLAVMHNAPAFAELNFFVEPILAALKAAGVTLKTLKFVAA